MKLSKGERTRIFYTKIVAESVSTDIRITKRSMNANKTKFLLTRAEAILANNGQYSLLN